MFHQFFINSYKNIFFISFLESILESEWLKGRDIET
jgi:hypothetical protein